MSQEGATSHLHTCYLPNKPRAAGSGALQATHGRGVLGRRSACAKRRTFTTSSGFTTSADATDAPLAAMMRSHSVSWPPCAAMPGHSRGDSRRNSPPAGQAQRQSVTIANCLQNLQGCFKAPAPVSLLPSLCASTPQPAVVRCQPLMLIRKRIKWYTPWYTALRPSRARASLHNQVACATNTYPDVHVQVCVTLVRNASHTVCEGSDTLLNTLLRQRVTAGCPSTSLCALPHRTLKRHMLVKHAVVTATDALVCLVPERQLCAGEVQHLARLRGRLPRLGEGAY